MSSPDLSVVIPSVNSIEDLRGCLDALKSQDGATLEIVVVDRLGEAVRNAVAEEFPDVIVIPTPYDATIPEMRALGFDRATADAVACIEDHVLVPPDWAGKLLKALEAGADVAGGPIENAAVDTRIDWAAFLCEYSGCLPPLEGGESTWLPGNNIVYRKSVLQNYKSVYDQGKWENHLHDAMRADGVKLWMLPDLIVDHKMHYTFNLYMSQRYLYARSYAGARVADKSAPAKAAYGLAAFALPPLMFYRTLKRITDKGRHLDKLWPSIPMIVAFVFSWGAGEVMGYWFGAGKSLSKVR
ncbi:MAG: glycosyltransferase family 2 protein [Parvularculaceae bacterium]